MQSGPGDTTVDLDDSELDEALERLGIEYYADVYHMDDLCRALYGITADAAVGAALADQF